MSESCDHKGTAAIVSFPFSPPSGSARRVRCPGKGSCLVHRAETDRAHKLWESRSLQFLFFQNSSQAAGDGCETIEAGPSLLWISQLAGSSSRHLTPSGVKTRSTVPPNS